MIFGVIGLRHRNGLECDDYEYVAAHMHQYKSEISEIISGGARGIESLVELWCERENVKFRKIKPVLNIFMETVSEKPRATEGAFTVRNNEIIAASDKLVAFWNGAEHMVLAAIATATKFGKNVYIIPLV